MSGIDTSSGDDGRRRAHGHAIQRACDECRAKKIRCNRQNPCSHCKAVGIACVVTCRPREKKARITLSEQYEEKIDRIEARLTSIELLLRNSNHSTPSSGATGESARSRAVVAPSALDEESPIVDVIATTGHYRDTAVAKGVLEQTISSSNGLSGDPQLAAAMSSLTKIVSRLKSDNEVNVASGSAPILANEHSAMVQVPSWSKINALLERAVKIAENVWQTQLIYVSESDFCKLAEALYRHEQDLSIAQRVIVNTGLYAFCSEFSAMDQGREADDYHEMASVFQNIATQALSDFGMLTPATTENITALLMGAYTAIDMCRPSLCWTLICVAIRMCQSLGWHRAAVTSRLPEQEKNKSVLLFWNCYIMDRSTSLRLGRAPAIQDYDVTTPRPAPWSSCQHGFLRAVEHWIDVARIQGQICEHLYTNGSPMTSPETKIRTAYALVKELEDAFVERAKDPSLPPNMLGCREKDIFAQFYTRDKVIYFSTLAMAYQSIATTPTVVTAALSAARAALRNNDEQWQRDRGNKYSWAMYCHWVTLHTPVMSAFTVLFCNIITFPSSSAEDMRLLQSLVDSLRPAIKISEGINKFYRLCFVFCEVASVYMQKCQQQQQQQQHHQYRQQIADHREQQLSSPRHKLPQKRRASTELDKHTLPDDFDRWLSDIGLGGSELPGNSSMMHDMNNGAVGTTATDDNFDGSGNADLLQDWYQANTSLYGLLEQDFLDLGWSGS